jgi:hypothetical protein
MAFLSVLKTKIVFSLGPLRFFCKFPWWSANRTVNNSKNWHLLFFGFVVCTRLEILFTVEPRRFASAALFSRGMLEACGCHFQQEAQGMA